MYSLPELRYGHEDLEPVISGEIMRLHHSKHHQGYVDKLNQALDGVEVSNYDLEQLLGELEKLPLEIRQAVRNNGGGHFNHSLFWRWMSPRGGGQPGGDLAEGLDRKYGNFQAFIDEFSTKATGLFGSGWVWLMPDFEIITTPNQDNPVMNGQPRPILGLDVWEHAYYLDYKNERNRYIEAWWQLVDWSVVENGLVSDILS